jgi:hypothetical protein
MLPGEAAGRIDEAGRRDQKAKTQPGAGVPRGSHAEIRPDRQRVGPGGEEAEARPLPGVAGPTEVAFDSDQPVQRELPIVAEMPPSRPDCMLTGAWDVSVGFRPVTVPVGTPATST